MKDIRLPDVIAPIISIYLISCAIYLVNTIIEVINGGIVGGLSRIIAYIPILALTLEITIIIVLFPVIIFYKKIFQLRAPFFKRWGWVAGVYFALIFLFFLHWEIPISLDNIVYYISIFVYSSALFVAGGVLSLYVSIWLAKSMRHRK